MLGVSAPDRDERSALLHFLAANRAAALGVLDGLAEDDARQVVVPSGWSPLDLAVHLSEVERHWFQHVLAGDPAHTPVRAGRATSLAQAVADYRAEGERSDRILADLGLDDGLTLQPEELVGEVTTVRGVLLHVIEEVARHAGHLDIARELIDGRTGLGQR